MWVQGLGFRVHDRSLACTLMSGIMQHYGQYLAVTMAGGACWSGV